jgi:hypothetical protein
MGLKHCTWLLLALLAPMSSAQASSVLYVSTSGNDTWAGRLTVLHT